MGKRLLLLALFLFAIPLVSATTVTIESSTVFAGQSITIKITPSSTGVLPAAYIEKNGVNIVQLDVLCSESKCFSEKTIIFNIPLAYDGKYNFVYTDVALGKQTKEFTVVKQTAGKNASDIAEQVKNLILTGTMGTKYYQDVLKLPVVAYDCKGIWNGELISEHDSARYDACTSSCPAGYTYIKCADCRKYIGNSFGCGEANSDALFLMNLNKQMLRQGWLEDLPNNILKGIADIFDFVLGDNGLGGLIGGIAGIFGGDEARKQWTNTFDDIIDTKYKYAVCERIYNVDSLYLATLKGCDNKKDTIATTYYWNPIKGEKITKELIETHCVASNTASKFNPIAPCALCKNYTVNESNNVCFTVLAVADKMAELKIDANDVVVKSIGNKANLTAVKKQMTLIETLSTEAFVWEGGEGGSVGGNYYKPLFSDGSQIYTFSVGRIDSRPNTCGDYQCTRSRRTAPATQTIMSSDGKSSVTVNVTAVYHWSNTDVEFPELNYIEMKLV